MTEQTEQTTRQDTEDRCHCGADYRGSDHCPECYCEQYEGNCCDESRWTRHQAGSEAT